MTLVALMLVRNEDWILGCSLRAALDWCDSVAIMDHASTDGTRAIVEEVAAERGSKSIAVYEWPDASRWDEMYQRDKLLALGRGMGGTHFAMIDADEILTANHLGVVRSWVEGLAPGAVLELPMIPVWDGLDHYRDDESVWSKSRLTVAFADKPGLEWAPRGKEEYHHHNRTPRGSGPRVTPDASLVYGAGGAMHLQWADWPRVVAKHRRYKILERVRYPQYAVSEIDARYNQAVAEREVKKSQIPTAWWGSYRRDLIRLSGPYWHDDDSRKMIAKRGIGHFSGLELFGKEWTEEAK